MVGALFVSTGREREREREFRNLVDDEKRDDERAKQKTKHTMVVDLSRQAGSSRVYRVASARCRMSER